MSSDFKIKVQSFGRFLSNMVMPNIGAFIAWGIITALFIPTGWLPNETLAKHWPNDYLSPAAAHRLYRWSSGGR